MTGSASRRSTCSPSSTWLEPDSQAARLSPITTTTIVASARRDRGLMGSRTIDVGFTTMSNLSLTSISRMHPIGLPA